MGFSSKKTSKEKEMKKERLRYCRLVVWPWKKVPRGTNGGVSLPGLCAAFGGAAVVALSSLVTLYFTSGLPLDSHEGHERKNVALTLLLSLTLTGKSIKNEYYELHVNTGGE